MLSTRVRSRTFAAPQALLRPAPSGLVDGREAHALHPALYPGPQREDRQTEVAHRLAPGRRDGRLDVRLRPAPGQHSLEVRRELLAQPGRQRDHLPAGLHAERPLDHGRERPVRVRQAQPPVEEAEAHRRVLHHALQQALRPSLRVSPPKRKRPEQQRRPERHPEGQCVKPGGAPPRRCGERRGQAACLPLEAGHLGPRGVHQLLAAAALHRADGGLETRGATQRHDLVAPGKLCLRQAPQRRRAVKPGRCRRLVERGEPRGNRGAPRLERLPEALLAGQDESTLPRLGVLEGREKALRLQHAVMGCVDGHAIPAHGDPVPGTAAECQQHQEAGEQRRAGGPGGQDGRGMGEAGQFGRPAGGHP
jgi:hypothetical protein